MSYFKKGKRKGNLKKAKKESSSTEKNANPLDEKVKEQEKATHTENIPQETEMTISNGNGRDKKDWNISDKIAFGSLCFGVIALGFTYLMWREAKKSNETIANQFDIENRPFIILATAKADTVIIENRPVNATLIIKNVGKSPAYFMYARFGQSLDTVFNPKTLKYTDTTKFEANRFIESGSTFSFIYTTIIRNPKHYYYILNNKTLLHNFGEVVYRDIVSGKRYSYKFSVRILPNGQGQPTQIGDKVTEIED